MVTERFKIHRAFASIMDYTQNPKIGSAPQFTFDATSRIRTYKSLIELLKAQYGTKKLQREYEPSSRPQGLLIGGAAVAASAMAAAQTPGEYSLPREAMIYLVENRRNESGDNLLKVDVTRNQLSKDKNGKDDQYKTYSALVKKYEEKIYQSQQKLRQVYRDAVSKISKLSAFYGGKVANAARKILHDPHKKSGLEGKLFKFPKYEPRRNNYAAERPQYVKSVAGEYKADSSGYNLSETDANYPASARIINFPHRVAEEEHGTASEARQPQSIDDLLAA